MRVTTHLPGVDGSTDEAVAVERRNRAAAAHSSARMWRRRAYLAQVLILAVLIGGVVYVADTVVGGSLFRDPYTLRVELAEAGGLHKGSVVTYRGQRIGRVTDVALTGRSGGAAVVAELSVDEDVDIPRDSAFEVRNLSAVGEQYLDVRPRTADGELYAHGDTVALADTSTPLTVPQVLADAQALMRNLDPADIRSIADETAAIFDGGDDVDLRALSIELETAFALLQDLEPTLTRLVRSAEKPLRTGVDLGDQVRSIATDLALVAASFRAATPDVQSTVLSATDLLPRLQSFWDDAAPRLRTLLSEGIGLTDMSKAHLRGLHHWLDWVPLQARAMARATRDGSGRVLLVPRVLKNCSYSPNYRRDMHDLERRPAPTDVHCENPPPGTQARGSGSVPHQGDH